ncbi:MAG: TetR/AcrR family transcriptional regulator [Cellulosilyticaceae bacterium]
MPKTKEQCEEIREQTKKQISDAAIRLFACRGFTATKISEVAKAAGVSMGLMYHYFSSKEELFSYLVEETTRLSNEGLLYFENLPLPPREKIMALAQMVVEGILVNEEQVPRFMMMIQAGLSSEEISLNKALYKEKNVPIEVTARIIKAAQEEGVAKEGDPLVLSTLFWAMVQGLCMQKLITKECTAMPTVTILSQMLLK